MGGRGGDGMGGGDSPLMKSFVLHKYVLVLNPAKRSLKVKEAGFVLLNPQNPKAV
jgi:hypothetical protein